MRSRSTVLAPVLFAVPCLLALLALACGEAAAPQTQRPIVVAPSAAGPVAEAAPDAAPSEMAAPTASPPPSAAEPVASVDAGASPTGGGKKVPSLRQGTTSVNGKLPPEVIQRIVRQNFGRFRLCYEKGLKSNPSLEGRVSVKFVIDRAGAVSDAKDGGSDLPHADTVSCVVQSFAKLSFPQPESGNVTVVYPVIFALHDVPPPPSAASGNVTGDAIGDTVGEGGLGLSGAGEGIGLGTLGSGSSHPAPSMREGAMSVNGRLPPEIIKRIVRQNFGRFRRCYETGLRSNPNLQGRVTVKFVIDDKGAVSDAKDGGSDLPSSSVAACVVSSFQKLSFPQPEAGLVTVVYPIIFDPGVAPTPPPSGSAKK
ncbi:hypothetical protein AKJ09_03735 [Labilithrix luteola]|uniref:Abductin-like protein n=1 Tax=Labilithrix luteola TaxID=1391654 RepID=A0A0K1PUK8_9BACT|nr:AgmX/PglI C-terminal domain-containing protein [Labilithrix luteola]AKU97071.1 hypothetical protein AKJ09_03735 [Labilithrix luteola]